MAGGCLLSFPPEKTASASLAHQPCVLLFLSAMSLADLVFGAVLVPLGAVWSVASRPSLALLRAGKLCPPPVNLLEAREDLSGRVIIVTGANTGEKA